MITSRLLVVFVAIEIVWSLLVILPQVKIFEFGFKFFDILFLLYLSTPLIIAALSLTAMHIKKYLNFMFWVSFVYWALISSGELLEGEPYSPNLASLLVILVLSILIVSVKLISNKTR